MRFRSLVLMFAAFLAFATQAYAAPIYVFSVDGTTAFNTDTIQTFSVGPGELVLTKEQDSTSPAMLVATAIGTTFDSATLIAYDGSPQAELFRLTLAGNVRFSSYQTGCTGQVCLDQVSLVADSITRTTAAVPEPATALLLLGGALSLFARGRRSGSADDR